MTKEEWNQVCLDYYSSLEEDIEELAEELITKYQITLEQAKLISSNVWYYRTRNRWTEDSEKQLVLDACNGIFHNMNEYP